MTDVVPSDQLSSGRVLYVNNVEKTKEHAKTSCGRVYCDNSVTTSKYTILSFVPKNLFEQFRRIANAYFLVISLLQLLTDLSPTNEYSTVGPLFLVLVGTMLKEAVEDKARHVADYVVNSTPVEVLDPKSNKYENKKWHELQVGNIVKLYDGDAIPADLVLLHTHDADGVVQVETSSLDGESNLKMRHTVKSVSQYMQSHIPFNGQTPQLRCEKPNDMLYQFNGVLFVPNNEQGHQRMEEAVITISNVVLRGMSIRNSKWVIGVVSSAGMDTKLMQNMKPVPSKFSRLDIIVNKGIILIFGILFILCTFSTILGCKWLATASKSSGYARYLPFVMDFDVYQFPSIFITYLILYNNLVPISLYICLEMVKWYQAKKIESDPKLFCSEKQLGALARTSNINEDVGQTRYIFSDKTGTLTRNEMVFQACSVGDIVYSGLDMELSSRETNSFDKEMTPIFVPNNLHIHEESHLEMLKCIRPETRTVNATIIEEFMRCMTLCHTVSYDKVEGKVVVRAASPDEASLLEAAKELDFKFLGRFGNVLKLKAVDEVEEYELLALNEFDSTRKAMSVVLRRLDGSIVVFCKGADSTMLKAYNSKTSKISTHVQYFASKGLRTLVFGKKELSQHQYEKWIACYDRARKSIVDRERKLCDAASMLEKDFDILGATGVEDRLQEGVPECIRQLAQAGINVWMLTGDKSETAISVAYSCGMLNSLSRLMVVDAETVQGCLDQISSYRRKLKREGVWSPDTVTQCFALVLHGSALETILSCDKDTTYTDAVSPKANGMASNPVSVLLELVLQCNSIIACRLCPMQKAEIVTLIKNTASKPVTMAIGDGGNDVSMIQEAHIGIGIYGQEGMQAIRAADFGLPQFQFISRLILVHGRWNYRRVSLVILFSFYKNMTLIMTLFQFAFWNGYSGQTLYDSYLIVGWNVLYTLMPIIVLGVADEDLTAEVVLQFPFVYQQNHSGFEFNIGKMMTWCGNALLHSVLVYTLTTSIFFSITSHNGHHDGLFLAGTAVYGVLVLTVSAKAALTMQRLHRWKGMHYASIYSSVFLYFLFVLVFSTGYKIFPRMDIFRDFFGISMHLFSQPTFWLAIPVVSCSCIGLDLAWNYIAIMYLPTSINIMQEIDSGLAAPPSEEVILGIVSGHGAKLKRHPSKRSYSLLGEAMRSHFRGDGNVPLTEHEELSAQLMTFQREIARESGKMDPVLRDEERETAQDVASSPATHALTMEFLGAKNAKLEAEYNDHFVLREARRVQVCMKIIAILIPPYALFEVYVEQETQNFFIRIGMEVLALIYLRYSHTMTFVKYYQASVLIPLALAGIGFTMTITATGKFAITALPIVLFSVLRVRFIYAVLLACGNFAFYLLADELGFKRNSSIPFPIEDSFLFTIFMIFIISFAAYSSYSLQMAMRKDFLQNRSLRLEQQRSVDILNNMLPSHVTERLQDGETLICDSEPNVTILFCDIVDFSAFTARHTATQLVSLLDRIYSLFDELCLKHGVQKMETVGKTYMACAGLQGKCLDPATAAAQLALNMLTIVEKCKSTNGHGIKLRIGLHSGRVISGLVGMKKQQFSLFGDTVNTASRMQSTGVTGRCQVSEETFNQLKGKFTAEKRTVEAKGKGVMTVYLLVPFKNISCSPMKKESNKIDHMQKLEKVQATIVPVRSTSSRLCAIARQLDPFSHFFGWVEEAQYEEEMQCEIEDFMLNFKDADMEKAYQKLTLENRKESSERTMFVLSLFIAYVAIRDVGVYFTNPFELFDLNKLDGSNYMAVALGLRLPYIGVAIMYMRWLRNVSHRVSTTKHRNTQFVLYYLAAILLCVSEYLLSTFDRDVQERYSNMCLDIIMVMFLASNGGSLLHRISMLINVSTMIIPTIFGILLYSSSDGNLPMYPLVLTCFTTIANLIASRGVEFFTRRKIWLKHQTKIETVKASNLLYKMLPEAVIRQLKNGETVCDQHDAVGLLFSDIKGFTSIASRAKTADVVNILGSLFTAFDKLTEKHGLFKMQTIGDAYVIASGLPYSDMSLKACTFDTEPSLFGDVSISGQSVTPMYSTNLADVNDRRLSTFTSYHLRRLVAMADDMHREVRKVKDPTTGERLQMRIGIHLGNIIGGVIGTTTLRYDMWGSDVLTANEMESNGKPEHTMCTEAVKKALELDKQIHMRYYKKVNFTGCGELNTYFVSASSLPDEYP